MNWAEAPIIPTRSALLRSAMTLSKEWQALIGPRPDIHAGRRSRRGDCSLIPKNYLSELLFARKKVIKNPLGLEKMVLEIVTPNIVKRDHQKTNHLNLSPSPP